MELGSPCYIAVIENCHAARQDLEGEDEECTDHDVRCGNRIGTRNILEISIDTTQRFKTAEVRVWGGKD